MWRRPGCRSQLAWGLLPALLQAGGEGCLLPPCADRRARGSGAGGEPSRNPHRPCRQHPSSHSHSGLEPGGPFSPCWWEAELPVPPLPPKPGAGGSPGHRPFADPTAQHPLMGQGWCRERSLDGTGESLGGKRFRTGVLIARAAPTAFSQMCLAGVPGARWGCAKDVSPMRVCVPGTAVP